MQISVSETHQAGTVDGAPTNVSLPDRKHDQWPKFVERCQTAGSAEIVLKWLEKYPRWPEVEVLMPRLRSLSVNVTSAEHLLDRFLRPSISRLEFKIVERDDGTHGVDGVTLAAALLQLGPSLVRIRKLWVRCHQSYGRPGLVELDFLWPFFKEIARRKELYSLGVSNCTITTAVLGLITSLPYLVELHLDGRNILEEKVEGSIQSVEKALEGAVCVDLVTLVLYTGNSPFDPTVLLRFSRLSTLTIKMETELSKNELRSLAQLTALKTVMVEAVGVKRILDGQLFKQLLSGWSKAKVVHLDEFGFTVRPWLDRTQPSLKMTDLDGIGTTTPYLQRLRVSLDTRLHPREAGPTIPLRLGVTLDVARSTLALEHAIWAENYLARLGIAHGRLESYLNGGRGWSLLRSSMLFGAKYGWSSRWWAGVPEMSDESEDSDENDSGSGI